MRQNQNMANLYDFDRGISKTKVLQPPGGASSISFQWNFDDDKVPIGRSKASLAQRPVQQYSSGRYDGFQGRNMQNQPSRNIFSNQAAQLLGNSPSPSPAPQNKREGFNQFAPREANSFNPSNGESGYRNFVEEANKMMFPPQDSIFQAPSPPKMTGLEDLLKSKEAIAYNNEIGRLPNHDYEGPRSGYSIPNEYERPRQPSGKTGALTYNKTDVLEEDISRRRIKVAQPPGKRLVSVSILISFLLG